MYDQDPNTSGRVILDTSLGEIEIHLYSNECPSACHNFLQLCLNNYYNNNKFFKVFPHRLIQTGDHTNTGFHFEYAFGRPFGSEFHDKIRFRKSGCVGFVKSLCLYSDIMKEFLKPLEITTLSPPEKQSSLTLDSGTLAMSGPGLMNGSQFFITLTGIEEYDYSKTLFGKVAEYSLPVLFKFNHVKINEYGDPLEEVPFIKRVVVIENPYKHIIPFRDYHREFEESRKEIESFCLEQVQKINEKLKTLKKLSFDISRDRNIERKKKEIHDEANNERQSPSDQVGTSKTKKRKVDDFLKYKETKERMKKEKQRANQKANEDLLRASIMNLNKFVRKKSVTLNANHMIQKESPNSKEESTDLQESKRRVNEKLVNYIDNHINNTQVEEKKKKLDETQKGSNYTLYMEMPTLLNDIFVKNMKKQCVLNKKCTVKNNSKKVEDFNESSELSISLNGNQEKGNTHEVLQKDSIKLHTINEKALENDEQNEKVKEFMLNGKKTLDD